MFGEQGNKGSDEFRSFGELQYFVVLANSFDQYKEHIETVKN